MKIQILIILFTLILVACQTSENKVGRDQLFEELDPSRTAIDFSNQLYFRPDLNIIEYLYYYNGGGVAVGDINNDGLEDIYFGANQVPDKLYLNEGNLIFREVTAEAGLTMDSTWSTGISMDDINGDGFLDIYVCKLGVSEAENIHNLLYINRGDGTFTERSEEYGLDFTGFSTQSSFFDYDKDGDLDMYLLNHSIHSVRSYGEVSKRKIRDPQAGDIMFENKLNESPGTFVDVSEQAGIFSSALGFGLAVTTSDINDDGWPDIYVGNDFHENDYLYLNNGDKTFTESFAQRLAHSSQFSMGVDIADMNNDGYLDIFTTDMMPSDAQLLMKSGGEDTDQIGQIKKDFGFGDQYASNHFQLNNGNHTFSDIAYLTNTFATDWSWSVLLQDYNNDGKNDIFITNGIVKRPNDLDYINFINQGSLNNVDPTKKEEVYLAAIDKMPSLKISNILYINEGNKITGSSFQKKYLGVPSYSNGAAYSDLDNDGDLDIVINNINDPASILKNNSEGSINNYISIALSTGINEVNSKGAKVTIHTPNSTIRKENITTRGFQSSSTHRLHFGLGAEQKLDSIVIRWPDGAEESVVDLEVNRHHEIQRSELIESGFEEVESKNNFQLSLFPYRHVENEFFDYDNEKLIPELLSREGPAIEVADFNNDSLNDIFFGGAVNQVAVVYIAEKNGSYTPRVFGAFRNDAIHEDVDAVAFDFENDGDLDLYVVSGGSDTKELAKGLQDRLYLNDGKGNFSRHSISLPHTNGSTVSAADYNSDGFTDLFVGARSIPQSYGLSPYSFILKNIEGQYFEPDYKQRFGMITDSRWIDINQDSLPDLVIAGDWMPIRIFINTGKDDFREETEAYGLTDTDGLWNTLEFADINEDGTLDILAGNAGLNFKWKATDSTPVTMYLNDFDKNGQIDPVIFYNYFGEFIPFSTKDQLTGAMPFIKKKFQDYQSFSEVRSIEELTGINIENLIEVKYIKELRSMVFLSKGNTYEGVALNAEAQMSSIEDFYIDKKAEGISIKFVGNFRNHTKNLGTSASNSGGELSDFNQESKTFGKYKSLSLPFTLNSRSIVNLDDGRYLIGVNNDYQYVLSEN